MLNLSDSICFLEASQWCRRVDLIPTVSMEIEDYSEYLPVLWLVTAVHTAIEKAPHTAREDQCCEVSSYFLLFGSSNLGVKSQWHKSKHLKRLYPTFSASVLSLGIQLLKDLEDSIYIGAPRRDTEPLFLYRSPAPPQKLLCCFRPGLILSSCEAWWHWGTQRISNSFFAKNHLLYCICYNPREVYQVCV